ncbi:MAG: sugar phosphate nucleotidyltransferase, partial [Burkholderiaceae bacterium]|nr:sugar phosphate nucleotidyltransferase [Burkholderiaceae bacterium]
MITNGIILAAGRGERMRPLTDHTPKPMLAVHGQPLMAWAAQRMQAGGVQTLIVNTAWLGEHIESHFGDHASGLPIHYSHEGLDFGRALETAGGIARALPL